MKKERKLKVVQFENTNKKGVKNDIKVLREIGNGCRYRNRTLYWRFYMP